jgi:PTS system galactitol-specific IIC component
MNVINEFMSYFLSFKPYIMLPAILFIFAIVFHIKISKAFKAAITIGVGFIGIFIMFEYFVKSIGPAVKALAFKTGLPFDILDVGWTPLAVTTWSYKAASALPLAAIMILIVMLVNVIMLAFKLTKTVNIDIWNYWHFIFAAILVYEKTNNLTITFLTVIIVSAVILKLADWSEPKVKKFANLPGISISTLSGLVYYPFGVIGNSILEKVPFINKIKASPENIKQKLGIWGEPSIIGFTAGCILGAIAGYEIKEIFELAFSISAVMYILPLMCKILGDGLLIISEGMKDFISKKFPEIGTTFIGLDLAVLLSNPAIIVTGLILMPIAILSSLFIPGINFIPIGDLAYLIGPASMVVVATGGNIVRALIILTPVIIAKLLVASKMAGMYTNMAHKAGLSFEGYNGAITSALDGGNLFRYWIMNLAQLNIWAIVILPIIIWILYYTWKNSKEV